MSDPNATAPIPELNGARRVQRLRRDPLKGALLGCSFATACIAGCWAIWTHREWIRAMDAAIVVVSVAEFARLMLARFD
jgi:hypothetical protein